MSLWKKGINRSITGEKRLEDYDIPLEEFCEKLKHKLSSKTKNSIYGCMDITYIICDVTIHWFFDFHHVSYLISQIKSNQHMLELLTKSLEPDTTTLGSSVNRMFLHGILKHLSYEHIINQPL